MQREAQGDDLDARLEAEDADEVGLRVVLRKRSTQCVTPGPRPAPASRARLLLRQAPSGSHAGGPGRRSRHRRASAVTTAALSTPVVGAVTNAALVETGTQRGRGAGPGTHSTLGAELPPSPEAARVRAGSNHGAGCHAQCPPLGARPRTHLLV